MATNTNTINYDFGFYSILINKTYGNFIEGDELITNCKNFLLIIENEWNLLRMNKSPSNNDNNNDNFNNKNIKKIIYPKKSNHKIRKYRENI